MSEPRSPAARACHAGALAALWSLAALLLARAYFDATYHVAFDARSPFTLGVCLGALAVGYAVAALVGRRGEPLGPTRHALCWIVTALAAVALTHVPPQETIVALREEVPPTLAWLYPALAFGAPIALRWSARSVDAADQALLLLLAVAAASGAALFLEPATVLGLALAALLLQLGEGGRLPGLGQPLGLAAAACVAWLLVATIASNNPLYAHPSMIWIGAAAATGLAVAARPRGAKDWIRILSAPVAAATVVALCDVVLTVRIATWFGVSNALDTRLELFRQHPNFLASLYGFHAVLATALLGVRTRARWFGVFAVTILAFATWHTDSNAGRAALLLGVAAIPVVWLLSRLARHVGGRVVAIGAVAVVALAGAGLVAAATGALGMQSLEGKVDRFRKSFEFRIAAWTNAAHVVKEHPVVGVGPHVLVAESPFAHGTRFATEPAPPHPHDVPLYVAQSGGLPALLAFLAWMVLLVARLFRAVNRRGQGALPEWPIIGLLSACGGLLAANVFDLGLALHTVVPWPLFWATGLALALAPPRPREAVVGASMLVTAAALALVFIFSLRPVTARVELARARVLAAEGPRNPRLPDPRARRVAALERALDLDPTLEDAYLMLESSLADDVVARLDLLARFQEQAPEYGHVLSRVGRLQFELGAYGVAAETLSYSTADRYWSDSLREDRARFVRALGHLGRAEEAEAALKSALISDHDTVLAFSIDEEGRRVVEVFDENREPATSIDIGRVLDDLRDGLVARRDAGHDVARRDWLLLFLAYRTAGLDEDAAAYLGFLEQNVGEIERESILVERARMAVDRGDRAEAVRLFEEAYRITGTESFLDFARQAAGRAKAAAPESLARIGDLMAWQPAYELALDTRIEAALSSGSYADAARDMERRLFFADDPGERARRLVQRAEALDASRAPRADIEATLRAAMEHLLAKPFSSSYLSVKIDESLPGRIARELHALGAGAGRSAEQIERDTLSFPAIRSARPAAILFRLGLHRETGNAEAMLRDARLLALVEPGSDLAFLSELTALEALAPPAEVRAAARGHVLRRILHPPKETPQGIFGTGVALLLDGAYSDAAGRFRKLFQKAPAGREAARALEWWARARLLGGSVEEAGQIMRRAQRSAPDDPMIRRRAEAWR